MTSVNFPDSDTTATCAHELGGSGAPADARCPFTSRKGVPLSTPTRNAAAPSRRLNSTAPGCGAAGFTQALSVIDAPSVHFNESVGGMVTDCPASLKPPAISAPSTGTPAVCALLPL